MLLELAIGDAYGAGFEYTDSRKVPWLNLVQDYVRHPRHDLEPGCYTDDTQMSIAVAEAVLSGEPWDKSLLARHFVAAFKRDPRKGYASGFYKFLKEVRDGEDFLARIKNDSMKNGAAMRSAPVGVFGSVKEVKEKAVLQASITHDTPDGRNSAVAAALMTHFFLYGLGKKAGFLEFLKANVPGDWAVPWRGEVRSPGPQAVHAAATAIMRHDTMTRVLQSCIAFTGDVDTVAAIAMPAASCCGEIAQDLPKRLFEKLENRAFGRDYIRELDQRLLALAARNRKKGQWRA